MSRASSARSFADDLKKNRENISKSNLVAYDNVIHGCDLVTSFCTIFEAVNNINLYVRGKYGNVPSKRKQ